MKNKKAAEMTIGTIVVIILALVVLVVLIYGFSTGWSNLWQNIIGYGGGQVNVQQVVDSCKLACTTQGVYDYCQKVRSVSAQGSDGKVKTFEATCDKLKEGGSFTVTKNPSESVILPAQDVGDCNINCNQGADACETAKNTLCKDANGADDPKCSISWMTLVQYNQAKIATGTGKTYKEVTTITSVPKTSTGDLCVKRVLN